MHKVSTIKLFEGLTHAELELKSLLHRKTLSREHRYC